MGDSNELTVKLEQAYQSLGIYDERYKVMPDGERDFSYGFKQYLNCLIDVLDKRDLTEEEIARYVLGDDPMRAITSDAKGIVSTKIIRGIFYDFSDEEFILLVKLLSKLTKRKHFKVVETLALHEFNSRYPFWYFYLQTKECRNSFRNGVFRNSPYWLKEKFVNAPVCVIREPEEPKKEESEQDMLFGRDPDPGLSYKLVDFMENGPKEDEYRRY